MNAKKTRTFCEKMVMIYDVIIVLMTVVFFVAAIYMVYRQYQLIGQADDARDRVISDGGAR